mgnify:CR=1 FL=1
MPIDKLTPRQLDSDADNKTISKVSMLDALNLYSGPDNDSLTIVEGKLTKSDAGNGILKNIKGNEKVEGAALDGTRVVGGVEDKKTRITYIFVYHPNASKQGVFAYDSEGLLPGSNGPTLRKIYTSSQFNFPQNGFVKADIVYSSAVRTFEDLGEDFEKDAIIYFTDGANEPRKINAYRAFEAGNSIHGSDEFSEADFITACPKTQLKPITFQFDNDETRSVSNFERTDGFQFAYQNIYVDGMESAISSYSDIAFPPSVIDQGAKTYVDHSAYNRCVLTLPEQGPEISRVRLLGRQGNSGSFFIIDEFSTDTLQYNFYNDKILKGVSTDEVNKQFDSVPRTAKSQSVSSNRLMYGNYLDGFNKSGTTATAEVIYKEKPEDFIGFDVGYIPSVFNSVGEISGNPSDGISFFLDFSEMPDFLPAETQVNLSVTLRPDKNFHYYKDGPSGISQTAQYGPQEPSNDPSETTFSGVNFQQSFARPTGDSSFGVQTVEATDGKIWGKFYQNDIASGGGAVMEHSLVSNWRLIDRPTVDGSPDMSDVQAARCGSSAANPVIIKGGPLTFFAKIKTTSDVDNARSALNLAVRQAITNTNLIPGLELTDSDNNPLNMQVLESSAEASHSFNLPLNSGDLIPQAEIGKTFGGQTLESYNKLICAVWGNKGTRFSGVPVGYFIIKKGDFKFRLKPIEGNYFDRDSDVNSHFELCLTGESGVETITCLHDTANDTEEEANLSWILISKDDLIGDVAESGIDAWLQDNVGGGVSLYNNPFGSPSDNRVLKGYGYQVGYLDVDEDFGILLESSVDPADITVGIPSTLPDNIINLFSLMDGEGGPGGGKARGGANNQNRYDVANLDAQGSVTVNPYFNQDEVFFDYNRTVFYSGELITLSPSSASQVFSGSSEPIPTTLPFLQLTSNNSFIENNEVVFDFEFNYLLPESVEGGGEGAELSSESVNFNSGQSVIEGDSPVNIYSNQLNGVESFKTEANHDFGIIYYDERGRHGFVDHLTSKFVEGYTNEERPLGGKGAVEVHLTLNGTPPEWAHSYKIAYAKNSTVQDFIQYTAGGAFVGGDPADNDDTELNKNIYVSLNYLQGHPVSYVSSFGARTPEGGLNLYKHQEGDKLKVISFFEGTAREYTSHEFDVVDLVDLGGSNSNNPLANEPQESQQGQFLVLKDNENASGFSYASVDSNTHNWGKNCVIEIRTPRKSAEIDEQVYYEVSDHYKIVKQISGELTHSVGASSGNPIILTKGDVWFRRVATNVREQDSNGIFIDIIPDDDGADPSPESNFKSVYLEAESATDLFKSNSHSYGRPNVIFEEASETIRENTITYSDPSNPESTKLRYSSFNASLANFKDLSETFGGIQYMGDHGDFVVVIQRDNVSLVPVGKNILSDASGNQQLIASRNVLNEAVVYPGRSGCDIDPSSVFDSGTEVFFANKNLGEVYRWSKNKGPQVISDIGVSSVLRAIFKKAVDLNLNTISSNESRIVGGWDPFKKEYLLSVVDVETKETFGVVLADQPSQTVAPGDADGDGDGGEDTNAPSGLTVFPTNIEFEELEVGKPETSVVNILNNDADFINITSITSSNPTYDVGSLSFPLLVLGELNLTVNALALEEGEQNGTLEINTDNLEQPRIILSITGSAVVAEPPVENLLPFTVAYNEHNNTSLNDEDMSVDLAIEYITSKTVDTEPVENHLKSTHLIDLINLGDDDHMGLLKSDQDFSGAVGAPDLLKFLERFGSFNDFGGPLDYNRSVLAEPQAISTAEAKSRSNQPKPKPTTEFKSVDDAINYLIVQGAMTVGEYLQLRTYLREDVTLNMTQSGNVGALDLIAFLQIFQQTTENSESAFLPSNQGGILVGITAQEVINWLIDDGTMTISQYFNLAQYVRPECKADSNEDNIMSTADLLAFLSVFGGPQYGEEGYGNNDPAFAF